MWKLTLQAFWLIDGNSSFSIGQTDLAERRIRNDNTISTEGNQIYTAIFIELRTTLLNSPPYVQESSEVLFRVQGEKDCCFLGNYIS